MIWIGAMKLKFETKGPTDPNAIGAPIMVLEMKFTVIFGSPGDNGAM